MKVKLFDKGIKNRFWFIFSIISGVLSFIMLFDFIPEKFNDYLKCFGYIIFIVLILIYINIWRVANKLTDINLDIDGSNVNIKCGDIFLQEGFKVIAFNEYFDTEVDDKIISKASLNGVFINKFFKNNVAELDNFFDINLKNEDILSNNVIRKHGGKTKRIKLGTIVPYNDFLLTAFSKFDENDIAILSMSEYIEFLINFWDRVNRVYAQKCVSVPIFGSGITRIREHKNIGEEELIKIMLWTFRLSEMKFKYPAELTIMIHNEKIGKINLFNFKQLVG